MKRKRTLQNIMTADILPDKTLIANTRTLLESNIIIIAYFNI